MTDKTQNDKKPGEKPKGTFHFNSGNMAGKKIKPEAAPEDSTRDRRESDVPKR
jgi:hypothetical protein